MFVDFLHPHQMIYGNMCATITKIQNLTFLLQKLYIKYIVYIIYMAYTVKLNRYLIICELATYLFIKFTALINRFVN